MRITSVWLCLLLAAPYSLADTLKISNEQGLPLPQVMVTRTPLEVPPADLSDDGYAPHGVTNTSPIVVTRFSDASGQVSFDASDKAYRYRARAQGYVDAYFDELPETLVLQEMTPEQHIASYPSNVWLSQVTFGGDEELKKTFSLNCAFCHQQASPFMRNERTEEQWISVIERMNTYGARLPEDDHVPVARMMQEEYRELRENPERVPLPRTWEDHLSEIEMTEWPIGDGFSQMHDFLLHPNGFIYIGDNLFDRIYELDPDTGEYTVYKVPHDADMGLGGIMGNRFKVFPKMYNYMGVHSFAYSKKDGNIFITPSMQQALLEFDVTKKEFIVHDMPEGFYPHTIRTDEQDRVWFTLALSSQVAMFNRETGKFVWAARLYANDIARIDPETDEITMIDFPYSGPRRLRVDADGDIWIVAFQDSLLVKYDPVAKAFTHYELPVVNELPYALNVDRQRGVVWVNGNQSDTILGFDIDTETWKVYPMPRQRFFTRDIEVSEEDGAIYTTNSHFPTWQSEGGVPTLLRITPLGG